MAAQRRIYLDHNASTPLAPSAADAMAEALANGVGNPSSIHAEGRHSRDLVEAARRQVATLVGGQSEEIVFTSSGTESVSLGLIGVARAAVEAGSPPRVLIGATEHPCVHGAAAALSREGFAVSMLAVDSAGVIDLDRARAQIAGGAAAVAVSLANHEVGTIQPIAEIAALSHEVGAHLVCDAVQAAGKIALDPAALGASAIALSAHKFYGPKGVGALWLDPGISIGAALGGGHQERERRPGTENVVGIVGAGVAAELAANIDPARADLEQEMWESIAIFVDRIGGESIGSDAEKLKNTTCFRIPGAPAEMMVQALDMAGFAVSAGAACSSGSLEPSPVLLAMGYDPTAAKEAIRVSTGRDNTTEDVEAFLAALVGISQRVRRFAT